MSAVSRLDETRGRTSFHTGLSRRHGVRQGEDRSARPQRLHALRRPAHGHQASGRAV